MTELPYRNRIAVAGHRGNAKYFPENTMAGFRSAVSLKPDMIEMDVHMTKDRRLVVTISGVAAVATSYIPMELLEKVYE